MDVVGDSTQNEQGEGIPGRVRGEKKEETHSNWHLDLWKLIYVINCVKEHRE